MSGGVDSSVAAGLLVEQGYDVVGVTLNLTPQRITVAPGKPTCCGVSEIADARRVCERLGIPHYVLDMRDAFEQLVIAPFVEEYAAGRTPNPCIRCNKLIKFTMLREKAREMGAEIIATGHYARIEQSGGACHLLRGVDRDKDQTYFLYALSQEQLASTLFPLGAMTKDEVRAKAAEMGLPVAEKAESQDICFAPEGGYVEAMAQYAAAQSPPGDIVHVDGRLLGRHEGISRYTIGQRRGLGVAWTEPLYVIGLDPVRNHVIVGPDTELCRQDFRIKETNFAPDIARGTVTEVTCRVRRNMIDVPATLEIIGDGAARGRFHSPVRAITPGQAAVFYEGERVIGGGTITEVLG